MKRLEALQALVEIREYLREVNGTIPDSLCETFNNLAGHLVGGSKPYAGWCQPTDQSKPIYQPKTGQACSCRPGVQRDNCPACEGTGQQIDFAAIRARNVEKHI